jgi:hypothetical protein
MPVPAPYPMTTIDTEKGPNSGHQHEAMATAVSPPPAPEPLPAPVPRPMPIMDPYRNSGERSSRFIEPPMMQEYTPAASVFSEDDMAHRVDAKGIKRFLRGLNALLHLGACVLPLVALARFMARFQGFWFRRLM